jgi:hypothetical protein
MNHITNTMSASEKAARAPVQRSEAFSIIPIFSDRDSRTIFTFKQWNGGDRINETWFEWMQVDIATTECRRSRQDGTSHGTFQNTWEAQWANQPAMTSRTRRTDEEEDQMDVWQIDIDDAIVDIPNITGQAEAVDGKLDAKGTTDSELVIESLNGPIITAVEGAWEGLGAGAFEGAVEGDMEMVGTGTVIGTDELTGTVTQPERKITLNGVEATIRRQKGTATWTMKPRYSRIEDITSNGEGRMAGMVTRQLRSNSGSMVWAFLFKAPDYVDPDSVGGIWDGETDIGMINGDRWLLGTDRTVAGQKMRISARNIHLRRRERLWLLAIVGRRRISELSTADQDFVHVAVGIAQRCENY